MTDSLISVIIPCYNQAQYLEECLQSVLDQIFQDWECIIINDGSSDNTEDIARKWQEKDKRFKYIFKQNGGLSSARNAGIDLAQGKWLQFLDCDDKIAKEKFSDASKYFANTDLVISNYQLFDETGYLDDYCYFLDKELSFRNLILRWDNEYTIPIHCAIFKKEKIHEKFNENLRAKEDWIFWLNYFKINPKYIFTNNRFAMYRVNKNSMTKNLKHMLHNEELAYLHIYDLLDSEMQREFFKEKIKLKNNNLINNLNLKKENMNLQNKLKSKRYQILDKLLTIIGK